MNIYEESRIQEILQQTLDLAADCDQAEVRFSAEFEALSRYANNNIQQNLAQEDATLGLTVVREGRIGTGNTNRLDAEGLRNMVESARTAAALQKPEKEILPLVADCPTDRKDSLDADTAGLSPEAKSRALGETFALAREEGLESSGVYSNSWVQLSLANSAGLYCHFQSSEATFSTTMHTESSSGWAEQQAKRAAELDVAALSCEARKVALQSRDPGDLDAGEYTVILPPAAVADLMMFINWLGFGAQSYLEGTSPMSGKIGEKLFSENLSILDDHSHVLSDGLPFDFEGLPRQRVTLVDRGVYRGPVHDRTTAKEAGVESTGHGLPRPNSYGPFPGNLVVLPGDSSIEEMIAGTDRGLYVTHLHYTNVQDPVKMLLTGMTRDGLFLVEDGRISRPVHHMRFTESIFNAFSSISALTREQKLTQGFFSGGFVLPGMKIERFTFTSESTF